MSENYPNSPGLKAAGTSQEAAAAVAEDAELLREQCLMLLQQFDLTADEIAEMLRKSVLSVRPRVSELHTRKEVFKAAAVKEGQTIFVRRKNASGMSAQVWTTKRAGQQELL